MSKLIFTSVSGETDLRELVKDCILQVMQGFTATAPETQIAKTEADQNFTIRQLAEYWQCHEQTILNKKRAGLLPFYQIGRKVFFKKSEIDKLTANPLPKGGR